MCSLWGKLVVVAIVRVVKVGQLAVATFVLVAVLVELVAMVVTDVLVVVMVDLVAIVSSTGQAGHGSICPCAAADGKALDVPLGEGRHGACEDAITDVLVVMVRVVVITVAVNVRMREHVANAEVLNIMN